MPKARNKTGKRRITFSVSAADANNVYLVGDFNNWAPNAHPMKSTGNHHFTKTVMLQPGTYQYKFIVDGTWQEDPENERTVANEFGTRNNVMHIE
jgi:1,4-alpha-glucan branching enzyme